MTFGEKLTLLRRQAGLSQEELAEKLQVSRQAVSRWESGETLPGADKLLALREVFSVSVDSLLVDQLSPQKEETDPLLTPDQQERNRRTALAFCLGLQYFQALIILWGLALQQNLFVLLGTVGQVCCLVGFEVASVWFRGLEQAPGFHRIYYRRAVWSLAILPAILFVRLFCFLVPAGYSTLAVMVLAVVVYLLICGGTWLLLRDRPGLDGPAGR